MRGGSGATSGATVNLPRTTSRVWPSELHRKTFGVEATSGMVSSVPADGQAPDLASSRKTSMRVSLALQKVLRAQTCSPRQEHRPQLVQWTEAP